MSLIKNFSSLASTPLRKKSLAIVQEGLDAIQPKKVMERKFALKGNTLEIHDTTISLKQYKRLFIIAFGKGAGGIVQFVQKTLGNKITNGFVIDTVPQKFKKLHFSLGTHPLPSEQNIQFTKTVLQTLTKLTEKDLVLVIICGGGSVLFEESYIPFEKLRKLNDVLLKSGATIAEMNVVRKHVSKVKGGDLAKHLYPAKVVGMIFSDVPGNDLSTIASGPTVMDKSTTEDLKKILKKYDILEKTGLSEEDFPELPKDPRFFKSTDNIIMLSNKTALYAMDEKAKQLGFSVKILSDRLQGDAKEIGEYLLRQVKKGEVLLAAGETTIQVMGKGKGGRNQALVLATLKNLSDNEIIVSVDSDGIDFVHFAGAIGDVRTVQKAKQKKLDIQKYLDNDDSTTFFEKVGDGILTGRLESNVSDLMMVIKEKHD